MILAWFLAGKLNLQNNNIICTKILIVLGLHSIYVAQNSDDSFNSSDVFDSSWNSFFLKLSAKGFSIIIFF